MGDLLYRPVSADLEVRSSGGQRTIVGIAVPYGVPQRINARLTEQFRRGAFAAQINAAHRIVFTRDHYGDGTLGGHIIGKATLLRDDAAGLYGEFRVSRTMVGDETLELVRDNVLTDLSIGFREGQNASLGGGIVERVTAELREVAVVPEGAYGERALVTAVRKTDAEGGADWVSQILAGLPTLPPPA